MTEKREDTVCIEVTFAAPVHISSEHQRRLVELIGEICDAYEQRHPDRVMWPFGIGSKMRPNPAPIQAAPIGRKHRISLDTCWPLRGADGRTYAERKRDEERKHG